MFVRASTRAATSAAPASARAFSSTPAQYATLRELEGRLKSIKNIEKITKSMKMIASTRLAKAQRSMQNAKAYGQANSQVFTESEADKVSQDANQKTLWVVVSSDRGLCGGIHSSVSKRARKEITGASLGTPTPDKEDIPVVVLGDKSKAQLSRAMPKNLILSFNQIGRDVPTFMDAAGVADMIEGSGIEYDKVNIVYNKFVSAVSYEAHVMEVFNAEALKSAPQFAAYELEDESLVKDLVSFSLANAIYAGLVEGHAAEISARRNAMDNATKNAGEMIEKLQMQFNRGRQATITNELVDIITGASAL